MWLPPYRFSSLAGRLRSPGARCTTDWTHGRNATIMRLARLDDLLWPSVINTNQNFKRYLQHPFWLKYVKIILWCAHPWMNLYIICVALQLYWKFVSNKLMMTKVRIFSMINTQCHLNMFTPAKLSGRHGLKLKLALWSLCWATAWIASSGTQEFGQKLTWYNKVRNIII